MLSAAALDRRGWTAARCRTELRRGRWQRLAPGVLLTRPDPPGRTDWVTAGLLVAGDTAVLSGWDAVRSRGIGPDEPPCEEVLLLVRGGRHRVVGRIRIRPSARQLASMRFPFDLLGGVLLASPGRAVADTALTCTRLGDVRAMVTAAVQRGLCTPRALAAELDCGPRNGSALLRRALDDVLEGARSVAEADAVQLLRRGGLTGWVANAPIHDATGRVAFYADLLWPTLRAIVEVDSREFHFSEAEWKATMRRHNALTAMGYAVAHYAPSDIRGRGPAWVAEVAAWLDERAVTMGVRFPA